MKTTALLLLAGLMCVTLVACDDTSEAPAPNVTPTIPFPDIPAPATQPAGTDSASPTTAPATQASATAVNQYCAVMSDHKIDPEVTLTQDGKAVGFCCADCIDSFKKEPAKYMAALR